MPVMRVKIFDTSVDSLPLSRYYKNRLPSDYPPTPPIRLPIIGHIPYLMLSRKKNFNEAFDELFDRYSRDGLCAIHLGTWKIVTIGSYELAKDCFKREELNFR